MQAFSEELEKELHDNEIGDQQFLDAEMQSEDSAESRLTLQLTHLPQKPHEEKMQEEAFPHIVGACGMYGHAGTVACQNDDCLGVGALDSEDQLFSTIKRPSECEVCREYTRRAIKQKHELATEQPNFVPQPAIEFPYYFNNDASKPIKLCR